MIRTPMGRLAGMRRLITGCWLTVLVVGSGCSAATGELTTTTMAGTTGEDELASDVTAIKNLWRQYSDSWIEGVEAGYAYMAANNHPLEGCTAEDFRRALDFPDGYRDEVAVDEGSVERDDDWVIPGGAAGGTIPDGRIYVLTVVRTYSQPGSEPVDQTVDLHTVVGPDGDAHFFLVCAGG